MAVVTQQKQDELVTQITVEVGKDDYLPKVNKSLRKIAKTAQMKGFRTGKVPIGMIKKMYGNNVLAEELDKILQDELFTYLEKEKINYLGRPMPLDNEKQDIDLKGEKDYNFSFELGITPEFTVNGLTDTYKKYKVTVDDKTLDEEISNLRRQYGKMSHPDEITENDVLKVKLTEVDGSGVAIEEGVVSDTHIDLKMISDEAVRADILKLKKGGHLSLDVFNAFDKDKEQIAKHILNIDEERLKLVGSRFHMAVEQINHLGLADLNQEFFDKIFGEGEVKDEAAMRTKMTEIIEENYSHNATGQVRGDIRKGVLSSTEIPLPDDFLKKFIKQQNEGKDNDKELEDGYPNFVEDLRWTLIRNKLSREYDIKVEKEEVLSMARRDMEQRMQYYGYGQIPEEQLQGIVDNSLKDKEYSDRIFSIVLEDKLFTQIQEKVEFSEEQISIEDFKKLNEEPNA